MKEYSKFISACIIGLKNLKPPWCTGTHRGLSNGTKSTPFILIKIKLWFLLIFSLMKTLENQYLGLNIGKSPWCTFGTLFKVFI